MSQPFVMTPENLKAVFRSAIRKDWPNSRDPDTVSLMLANNNPQDAAMLDRLMVLASCFCVPGKDVDTAPGKLPGGGSADAESRTGQHDDLTPERYFIAGHILRQQQDN